MPSITIPTSTGPRWGDSAFNSSTAALKVGKSGSGTYYGYAGFPALNPAWAIKSITFRMNRTDDYATHVLQFGSSASNAWASKGTQDWKADFSVSSGTGAKSWSLTAYKDILNDDITIASVKRAIKDVIRVGTYIPTPEIIIGETARYYGLTEEALRGQSRLKNTATARQVAMYLCRTLTNLSLVDIGHQFEDRNHATVLASTRKIEDLVRTSTEMAGTIRDITSNINAKN